MPENYRTTDDSLYSEFESHYHDLWYAEAEKALRGAPFDKKMLTPTYEGITLKPLYIAEDVKNNEFTSTYPGFHPFVRGNEVFRKSWLVAQKTDKANAQDLNTQLKEELARGLSAIHLRLDTASRLGVDPDTADETELMDGFSLATISDLEEALADIDLDKYPLRVDAGVFSIGAIALFAAYRKDTPLKGLIASDPIAMLVRRGRLSSGLPALYAQMIAVLSWAKENAPELKTFLVDASVWHNCGANAVQEIAFALSTAVEYATQVTDKGLQFEDFAKHVQFSFSVGANLFMELAKLRAFRLVWSRVAEAWGAVDFPADIHIQTSEFTKTVYDPFVNLLRATTEAFTGVVGGADSIEIGTFDEVLGSTDSFSRRIARNMQIMLAEEFNLTAPIDPAGGSWYIEALTEELAKRAWGLFQEIESAGGMVSALVKGSPQKMAEAVLSERRKKLAGRRDIIVGTNMFANLSDKGPKQVERNAAIDLRKQTVRKVRQAVYLTEKTVPRAIEAAKRGASLGVINRSFSMGISPQITPVTETRGSLIFEEIRMNTEKYIERTGSNLKICLVTIGPLARYKARADFIKGFFEVGAFEVLTPEGTEELRNIEKADVVVICGADADYPAFVPEASRLIKNKLPNIKLFLAGLPTKDEEDLYSSCGVDAFIHIRSDCHKILADLQVFKGMTA